MIRGIVHSWHWAHNLIKLNAFKQGDRISGNRNSKTWGDLVNECDDTFVLVLLTAQGQKIDKPFNKSMTVLLLVSNLWAQVTTRKKNWPSGTKKAINSVLIDLGTSSWLISYSWALVRSWLGPKKDQSIGKKLVGAKPNSDNRAPILRSANISKPYLTRFCVSKYFSYLDQKVVRANLN